MVFRQLDFDGLGVRADWSLCVQSGVRVVQPGLQLRQGMLELTQGQQGSLQLVLWWTKDRRSGLKIGTQIFGLQWKATVKYMQYSRTRTETNIDNSQGKQCSKYSRSATEYHVPNTVLFPRVSCGQLTVDVDDNSWSRHVVSLPVFGWFYPPGFPRDVGVRSAAPGSCLCLSDLKPSSTAAPPGGRASPCQSAAGIPPPCTAAQVNGGMRGEQCFVSSWYISA